MTINGTIMVHIHLASDAEARDHTTALVTYVTYTHAYDHGLIAKRLMINLFSSVIY